MRIISIYIVVKLLFNSKNKSLNFFRKQVIYLQKNINRHKNEIFFYVMIKIYRDKNHQIFLIK